MSVRRTDNRIVQFGASLGDLDGCDIVAISDTDATALHQTSVDLSFVNGQIVATPATPPVAPTFFQAEYDTLRTYYTDAGLTAALGIADGQLSAAQRDYAIKNGIRALRALTRIVRGLAT